VTNLFHSIWIPRWRWWLWRTLSSGMGGCAVRENVAERWSTCIWRQQVPSKVRKFPHYMASHSRRQYSSTL